MSLSVHHWICSPGSLRILPALHLGIHGVKAPMAFITASDFPQLYAVVFGEGVLNDVPFFDKFKTGLKGVFFPGWCDSWVST